MTREEALERIKVRFDKWALDDEDMKAIQTLIPELRESEDERIRKELKEAFEAYDIESKWNGIPIRSIFAWLEKQKEPKHDATDAKSERVIKAARSVLNNWLDGTDCPDVSGDFAELEYAIREYDGEEKQKEPENTSASTMAPSCWQKEQKDYNKLYEDIGKSEWFKKAYEGKSLGCDYEQKEQKPDWSEEDEAMRDNILRLLSCFVGTLECDSNPSLSTSYPAYQREMNWLKSLRPSWKPSEEQMEALRRAVNKLAKTDVADSVRLSIMYDNLKKL